MMRKPESDPVKPDPALLKKQQELAKVSQARKDSYDQPIKDKELQSYRDKKSRQWNFEANLNKQVEEEAKTFDDVLTKRSLLRNNDNLVKDGLRSQHDALQEKLRQRRDRSFNKSMNRNDDKSVDEGRPRRGESFFKPKKEDLEEDMDKDMLATNILRLLDDIGPGKPT
jgi:hypothetical protein